MAETLGSLVDKLTIKNIRQEFLGVVKGRGQAGKIRIVKEQRDDLIDEINRFLIDAVKGKVRLKELKVKLYNKPVKKRPSGNLGELINGLASKNLELWKLEDEVRRRDVSDSYIAKTKRKIDVANQMRNDLIDAIDVLLEKNIKKRK